FSSRPSISTWRPDAKGWTYFDFDFARVPFLALAGVFLAAAFFTLALLFSSAWLRAVFAFGFAPALPCAAAIDSSSAAMRSGALVACGVSASEATISLP